MRRRIVRRARRSAEKEGNEENKEESKKEGKEESKEESLEWHSCLLLWYRGWKQLFKNGFLFRCLILKEASRTLNPKLIKLRPGHMLPDASQTG